MYLEFWLETKRNGKATKQMCNKAKREREEHPAHFTGVVVSLSLALKIKVILTVSIRFKLFDLLSEFD